MQIIKTALQLQIPSDSPIKNVLPKIESTDKKTLRLIKPDIDKSRMLRKLDFYA